jgi:predicted phage terminase large subunit-like protein
MVVHRLNDPKTGRILVVGQRLHEYDLSGVVISQGYPTLTLPFAAIEPEDYVYSGGVFQRAVGEALHPDRFGPEQVAELKRTTLPHVYSTQYQQVPRRMASGEIKADDFPNYETVPANGEVVFSWDVASTTGPASSNSVCLVFQQHGKIHYLRHVWKNRVHFGDLKDIAIDLHSRFKPSRHLIEAASLGNALGAELSGRGAPVDLLNTGPSGKQQRLEAQFHQIKGKSVFLPRSAEWRDDFLDELLAFPHGSRDDQVDALSQYLTWASSTGSRPPAAPVSVDFGGARGDRRTRSARFSDMVLRARTRR